MLYKSTNKKSPLASFKDALLRGQAPDYGLYIPVSMPRLAQKEIKSFSKKKYHDIAFEVIKKFLANEIEDDELEKITNQLSEKFEASEFTVKQISMAIQNSEGKIVERKIYNLSN